MDNLFREELLLKYFLEFENSNNILRTMDYLKFRLKKPLHQYSCLFVIMKRTKYVFNCDQLKCFQAVVLPLYEQLFLGSLVICALTIGVKFCILINKKLKFDFFFK